MSDVIGNPTLRAEFDSRALLQGARDGTAKLKTTFEQSNRTIEAAQRNATKRIQGLISQLNAERPRRQMFELGQAVQHMGGLAQLSEGQVARLRKEVERLTAAGAKAPKSLASLVPSQGGGAGGALADAAQQQVTGTLTSQAGGLGGVLGSIGPAGLAAAAGVGAFVGSFKALAEISERGTAVVGVRNSFRALAGDSDALLEASRRATGGMISDFDLMQTANKGLLLGLPITAEEMETLGKTAVSLGRAMNVGPTQALQDLITGLGRGSAAILDNLGITIKAEEAQRRYAESIGKQANQLTDAEKKIAIYRAALDAAKGSVDAIGVSQATAGDGTARLAAQWQNLKDAISVATTESDGAKGSFGGLADVLERVADLLESRLGQAAIGGIVRGLTAIATGGLSEIAKGYRELKEEFSVNFGGLGAAADLSKRDSRTGRIFSPEGVTVPKGPSDVELELERRSQERRTKADAALAEKKKELAEGLARAAASARKLAFDLISGAPGGPTTKFLGLETLTGSRTFGPGEMVGAQNFGSITGIPTAEESAENLAALTAAQKAAEAATTSWSDSLADIANLMQGLGGITGKFGQALGGIASGISGVGSFFSKLKSGEGGGLGKSVSGFLGKLGGGILGKSVSGFLGKLGGGILGKIGGSVAKAVPFVGTALAAVGIGKSLVSGIKSLFGGDKTKKEAAEASRILGEKVTAEELKSLKQQAEQEGKDWRQYLKERKAADDKARAVEARQKLEQGLGTARGGAEALIDRLAKGGLSEGLTTALQTLIGKVGDALLRNGLGILDPQLQKSEAFRGAQDTAAEVAQVIAGMREAGLIDQGLLAAGGAAAGDLQRQATEAALAEGKSPEEAAKAGIAAVAPLLREQLNASIQSGKELDATTKQLLEEAKANGIEILADPAIESLDVQRDQLGVLKEIARKGGAAGGDGGDGGNGTVHAAKGLGPVKMPNMGGGLGPLIQTHAGELALILPAHMARRGGIIHAARGLSRDTEGGGGDGPGGGTGGGPGGGGGGGGTDTDTGEAPSTTEVLEQFEAAVERVLRKAQAVQPVTIQNPVSVQIVDESVVKTIEGQRAFGRHVVAEVERALDQNSRGLESRIERIAKRTVG